MSEYSGRNREPSSLRKLKQTLEVNMDDTIIEEIFTQSIYALLSSVPPCIMCRHSEWMLKSVPLLLKWGKVCVFKVCQVVELCRILQALVPAENSCFDESSCVCVHVCVHLYLKQHRAENLLSLIFIMLWIHIIRFDTCNWRLLHHCILTNVQMDMLKSIKKQLIHIFK